MSKQRLVLAVHFFDHNDGMNFLNELLDYWHKKHIEIIKPVIKFAFDKGGFDIFLGFKQLEEVTVFLNFLRQEMKPETYRFFCSKNVTQTWYNLNCPEEN